LTTLLLFFILPQVFIQRSAFVILRFSVFSLSAKQINIQNNHYIGLQPCAEMCTLFLPTLRIELN